jgi:hypothetical protein
VNGDGCSATCQIEGNVPNGATTPVPPPPPVCGNGLVETGEGCDNGLSNGTPSDLCKVDCTFLPILQGEASRPLLAPLKGALNGDSTSLARRRVSTSFSDCSSCFKKKTRSKAFLIPDLG